MCSEGRTLVEDEQRSGRQSATRTGENTARVRDLVRSDRRLQSEWLLIKWTWTEKLFVWYWLKNWGWEKCVPRWCPRSSQSNSGKHGRLNTVFDIQMHYGDAAASLLAWSRTLRLLFISKFKTALKGHHFESTEDIQMSVTRFLKRHPTKCIPGMLQTMAAPLDMVCAGTRDVLWMCPRCS
jgi:hypothetical protein